MKFRPLPCVRGLCCAALLLLLPACALLEPGRPAAATTVRARSSFQVSDVVERVFIDEGYQPTRRSLGAITFDQVGGKMDRMLYGNWIGGEVAQRVEVTITPRRGETYRVRCMPSVVRDPNDAAFEDSRRKWEVHSMRLSKMLREVRRQCEELWNSRTPDTASTSD